MAKIYGEKIFERLPHVNLVCGPANIYDIPDLLEKLNNGVTRITAIDKEERPNLDKAASSREKKISAYVSIMEGCDNFCSYCVVPYARGHERSRSTPEILEEIKCLIECGYKDITLLGQNVNSYSSEAGNVNFVRLLEEVDKISGDCRIRFTTSHPKDVSEDLFKAMRELKSVCEHLHLPVQSGSGKILEAMNRKYTSTHYIELVEKLMRYIPDCAITTDIIVGFPGETDDDFEATKNLMEDVQFDSAFIFKYSPRPKTAAAALRDDIPKKVKEERNQVLLKLQDEISLRKNQALVGRTVEVLAGRTRTNKIVLFPGQEDTVGKFVNVSITRATPHALIGEI